MSVAKSLASGLSGGKNSTMQSQSFSSCQYGSKSSLCFVPKIARSPFPKVCFKTRDTQTIHRASVPLYSLLLFTGHYDATGAL